jgi:hypothetical protein
MSKEQALAVMVQIDLLKKRKGHGWQWRDIQVLPDNEACVRVQFNVSTTTVQRWFAQATANAFRIENQMQGWWCVWFDLMPIEMGEF